MGVELKDEKQAWKMQFNPCGMEPINGYVYQACVSTDCMTRHCLAKTAFQMAGYLLDGETSIEAEEQELNTYLRSGLLGKRVVSASGNIVDVNREDIPEIVKGISEKAQAIANQIDMCTRMSTPLTDVYKESCTQEQLNILSKIGEKIDSMDRYHVSLSGATVHEEEIQSLLNKALDLDLGELGIIARLSITFGLGERVPQFAASSEIFKYPGWDGLQPTTQR